MNTTSFNYDFVQMLYGETLILLFAMFLVFLFRKYSAALKHRIWTASMLALVLFPFVYPILPPLFLTGTSDASPMETVWTTLFQTESPLEKTQPPMSVSTGKTGILSPSAQEIPEIAPAPKQQEVVAQVGNLTLRSPDGFTWGFIIAASISVIYFGVALGKAVKMFLSHFSAYLWIRRSKPISDPNTFALCYEIKRKSGYYPNVRFMENSSASVPFSVSVFWPTVILPSDHADWPQEELTNVLEHELAHIRRRDLFWQLFVQWAEVLLWFHPLFWYAKHRIRIEQELACDDAVLRSGGNAVQYADMLVEMAGAMATKKFCAPSVSLPITRAGAVKNRVASLLDATRDHRAIREITSFWVPLALIVGLVVGVMFVRRPDESQRLYTIAVTKNMNQYASTIVRGKVLMPDGTAPKKSIVTGRYYSFCRDSGPSFFRRISGSTGGYNDVWPSDGEPFELKMIVGSNAVLAASTSNQYGCVNNRDVNSQAEVPDVYVSRPYAFSPEKDNEEIILQLEPATPLVGRIFYENGEPAAETGIAAVHYVPAAKGADIPRIQNESTVSLNAITNDKGEFSFSVFPGEFTLCAAGTAWSQSITKKVFVEQGQKTEADLVIPTPLRITVLMPDGSPASNFRAIHLASYYHYLYPNGAIDVSIENLYQSKNWSDDPEIVFPKRPIPMSLSNADNYIAIMTDDNEWGIVQKIEPEMRGKELTITLRPTISGTAEILEFKTKKPLVMSDVTLMLRVMKTEYNGSYTERSGCCGTQLVFQTDENGNLNFKMPQFADEYEDISFHFERGNSTTGGGGSTARHTGWFPGKPDRDFQCLRPDPNGQPLQLGKVALER